MYFKQNLRLYLSCVSSEGSTLNEMPASDRVVCNVKVSLQGKNWMEKWVLSTWDKEKADAMHLAVGVADLRIIAQGIPAFKIFNNQVQKELKVDDLWVEDILEGKFVQIISRGGVVEEPQRVFEPIEIPDPVALALDGEGKEVGATVPIEESLVPDSFPDLAKRKAGKID